MFDPGLEASLWERDVDTHSNSIRASCLPTVLLASTPACAIPCLETFVATQYAYATCANISLLDYLCTTANPSGLTIGEGGYQCVVANCPKSTWSNEYDYSVCDGVVGAIPNTLNAITATLAPATAAISAASSVTSASPSAVTSQTSSSSSQSSSISSSRISSKAPSTASVFSPTSALTTSTRLRSTLTTSTVPSSFVPNSSTTSTSTRSTSAIPAPQITSGASLTPPKSGSGLSHGQIAGVVIGSIVSALLVLILLCCIGCRRKRKPRCGPDDHSHPFIRQPPMGEPNSTKLNPDQGMIPLSQMPPKLSPTTSSRTTSTLLPDIPETLMPAPLRLSPPMAARGHARNESDSTMVEIPTDVLPQTQRNRLGSPTQRRQRLSGEANKNLLGLTINTNKSAGVVMNYKTPVTPRYDNGNFAPGPAVENPPPAEQNETRDSVFTDFTEFDDHTPFLEGDRRLGNANAVPTIPQQHLQVPAPIVPRPAPRPTSRQGLTDRIGPTLPSNPLALRLNQQRGLGRPLAAGLRIQPPGRPKDLAAVAKPSTENGVQFATAGNTPFTTSTSRLTPTVSRGGGLYLHVQDA